MCNDQPEESSFERLVHLAKTSAEFRTWLERNNRECEMLEARQDSPLEEACAMKYTDSMSRRVVEDLQINNITDAEIVKAAEEGRLDDVAVLLEPYAENGEVAYMIERINTTWRTDRPTSDAQSSGDESEPSGEAP